MEEQPMIRTRNYINLAHQTSEDELDHLELDGSLASELEDQQDGEGLKVNKQSHYMNENQVDQQTNDEPYYDHSSEVLRATDDLARNARDNNNNCHDHNYDRNFDGQHVSRRNKSSKSNSKSTTNWQRNNNETDDTTMIVRAEERIELLRDLLIVERNHSQKRAQNNAQLSMYIGKLQSEYLSLQADLAATLETAKRGRAQLETQISRIEDTVREKDRLIDQLRHHLDSLDETKLRAEFERRLEQTRELSRIEKQQIEAKYETIEQQLIAERVSSSNLLQEFQSKLENKQKLHEQELDKMREIICQNEAELEVLLSEPKNEIIKSLREDKAKLTSEVESLELILAEARAKQDSLSNRVQSLVKEAEQSRLRWEEESVTLQETYFEQRKLCNQLKMDLMDMDEQLQISEFNFERSDARVKSLLETLKSKEEAYSNLIDSLDARHELVNERTAHSVRNLERIVAEQANQLEAKQNELVRIELRHQNQLDSLRSDRDERLESHSIRLEKLQSELESTRAQLNEEREERVRKSELAEIHEKEANQYRLESDRLALELEKREANLVSKDRLLAEQIEAPKLDQQTKSRKFNGDAEHAEQFDNLLLLEARRHAENLEKSIAILRAENERLVSKLQINEAVLSQASANITKERNKLLQDYESKFEQFKSEWRANDKSRLRYRKYGYKLKRYFEHLRQTHSHICDSSCSQNGFANEALI